MQLIVLEKYNKLIILRFVKYKFNHKLVNQFYLKMN